MMFYISMKFHKNIMEQFSSYRADTNYNCQISKENNSKNVQKRVTVLVGCMSSDDALYFYEVS